MSQAAAAEALGVSRSALNAWENDRAYPRSSIGAIEELYGISLDDEPEQRPAVPPGLLREIMYTEGLTLEQRQAVIAAVEATLAREAGVSEGSSRESGGAAGPERRRPAGCRRGRRRAQPLMRASYSTRC